MCFLLNICRRGVNYFKRIYYIYIDRWKECKIEIEVDKIESEIDRKFQKL